ncbi:hypothetical protein GCM10010988_32400 [Cnuibacter physcomitrellae]|nr:hypothetical protein GCM10010988_32400 [Cnuibacter physcomitrellae]
MRSIPEGDTVSDTSTPGDEPFFDREEAFEEANDLETNDAVAGETVWEGPGDGNDGPTGGSPREGAPDWSQQGDTQYRAPEAPEEEAPGEFPSDERLDPDLGPGVGDGPEQSDPDEETV